MDMDAAINADNKEQLQVEETDDSCRVDFIEIVPLTKDTDGSCATDYVSGDWSAEVKQENLAVVKQEPDDVDDSSAMCRVKNDTVTAEVDETQSHMQSFVEKRKADDDFESNVNDAVSAEVDETHSHVDPVVVLNPVVVLETVDFAYLQKKHHIWINTGECSVEVKTEADSSDHTEHSHDDKLRPYLCTMCGKRFTWKQSLKVHRNRHTEENLYSCTQCGKRFFYSSNLWQHMNIHTGKYKCTECSKCFHSSRCLADHTRRHSGEKPFECTVCSKRFTTSDGLVLHSRIHSGEKPYKCHVCYSVFDRPRHLKVHMRVHTGEKPYKCRICDKAFSRSGDINVHTRVHTGEKPYKCSLCNKSFNQSSNLHQHKRRAHSNTTDELKQDESV